MTDDLKKLAEAAKAAVEAERRHHHTWEWGLNGDHAPWPSEGARKRFAEAATPDAFLALIRERDEAREALETIANLRIPDQPAHFSGDELEWAQRHVSSLRRIAIEALTKEPHHV